MHHRKHAQKFDTFCEIWVLTPSFFGTSLRSHYPIFSSQIKQENWLTYCSMKIQNNSCDKGPRTVLMKDCP